MLKRRETPNHSRYLTFSCYKRRPFFDSDQLKREFTTEIARARKRHSFKLFAWVIMPEHVHLLIKTDVACAPVPAILRSLKAEFAKRTLAEWRRASTRPDPWASPKKCDCVHFWQRGGGYDRNIFSCDELIEKTRYIHANPVRRGLATYPTDWPWSSARWYQRHSSPLLEMDHIALR